MKRINAIIIGLVLITGLGLLISASLDVNKYKFSMNSKDFLNETKQVQKYFSPTDAAESIVSKNSSVVFVDVRDEDQFNTYHLENAVNIPVHKILNTESVNFYNTDVKKVLYCNDGVRANQVWMLLSQYGIKNIYVLQGGLNYFTNNIVKQYSPKGTAFDDEILLYDYNKMVQSSGSSSQSNSTSAAPAMPVKSGAKKKKTAEGGCS